MYLAGAVDVCDRLSANIRPSEIHKRWTAAVFDRCLRNSLANCHMIFLHITGKSNQKFGLQTFTRQVGISLLDSFGGVANASPFNAVSRPLLRALPGLKYTLLHKSVRQGLQPCFRCRKQCACVCESCVSETGSPLHLCQRTCHWPHHQELLRKAGRVTESPEAAEVRRVGGLRHTAEEEAELLQRVLRISKGLPPDPPPANQP